MNQSISLYVEDTYTNDLEAINKAFGKEGYKVVENGPTWIDPLSERTLQLVTVLNVEKKEYNKIKNRKAVRELKQNGLIRNW